MAKFGKKSKEKLYQLHPDLRKVLETAIKHRDFSITEGHRDKQTQDQYYRTGESELKYPESKHNKKPSEAADIVPWFSDRPHIRWNDIEAFKSLGNYVIGVGAGMGIKLRWGGDWKSNMGKNWTYEDQKFNDFPHIELVNPS